MGQVHVKVAGRDYTLACDDGEEQHLTDLAQYIDAKARTLARDFSSIGETRLLLMSGLLVTDELGDAVSRIEELEAQVRVMGGEPRAAGERSNGDQAARLIENLAARLEAIADRAEAS